LSSFRRMPESSLLRVFRIAAFAGITMFASLRQF
jgi:hypothetical protein